MCGIAGIVRGHDASRGDVEAVVAAIRGVATDPGCLHVEAMTRGDAPAASSLWNRYRPDDEFWGMNRAPFLDPDLVDFALTHCVPTFR